MYIETLLSVMLKSILKICLMFSWGGFPCNPYINLTRVGSVHQEVGFEYKFVSLCAMQIRDKGRQT